MKSLLRPTGLLRVVVATAWLWSVAAAQEKAATPAERYQALVKEFENGRLSGPGQKFLEFAEQNPDDPIALDALLQTILIVDSTIFPDGSKDSPGTKALALVRRDHIRSDKLGRICQIVLFGFHKSHEEFLRAVLDLNPHRDVQGLACLSLAQYLKNGQERLDVIRDQDTPDMLEHYQKAFGKEYIAELLNHDRAAIAKEAEALLERAAASYGDVKIPVTYYGSGGTVGETAAGDLFQIRNLAIGKTAPEIEGTDQDGQPFKLSDYRGKVVLLDFWHRL
jgi:hypothetical protein